jgi:hypothetical protein
MFERELELLKAAHSTFTDLPLITDVSGTRTTLPEASQAALGFLSGKKVLQILSSYLSDFFGSFVGEMKGKDCYLDRVRTILRLHSWSMVKEIVFMLGTLE